MFEQKKTVLALAEKGDPRFVSLSKCRAFRSSVGLIGLGYLSVGYPRFGS
jgi:hypothetical protein